MSERPLVGSARHGTWAAIRAMGRRREAGQTGPLWPYRIASLAVVALLWEQFATRMWLPSPGLAVAPGSDGSPNAR